MIKQLDKETKGVIIIEGHVQGLANCRALGRAGIPVIVVDKDNCITRYSKYCQDYFKCPDYRTDAFAHFLVQLAENEKLNGWILMPSNDHAVYTISKHRDLLVGHFKVITPPINIIDNIYKKHLLLSMASGINIPIPATWYPQKPEDLKSIDFIFPVMIKGKEGLTFYKTTGRKVFLANNKNELNNVYRQIPPAIGISDTFIQEIIPTDEHNKTISFTAFCVEGEIKAHWTGVKLREHPAKFGTSTFSESIKNEEVLRLSKSLLKTLDYTGVCEVEYLLDHRSNKYKLIEINARTWLWVGLAIECGVNYPLMIYNHLNGIDMEYPKGYKVGLQWMNQITDMVHSMKSILGGRLSLNNYLKSLRGKKVHAIYCSDDLLPPVMFFILLPYLALKRG